MTMRALLLCVPLLAWQAGAQKIPDVSCKLEDYAIDQVIYWQATVKVGKVQVAVLRDPAGEQEARFDLMHGASLLSLRYRGKGRPRPGGARGPTGRCTAPTRGEAVLTFPRRSPAWRATGRSPCALMP